MLNKIGVKDTVNFWLPSQTPTSIPSRFRWHIIVSVPKIKCSPQDWTTFSKRKKWKFEWSQDLIFYKEEWNEKLSNKTYDGFCKIVHLMGQTDNICLAVYFQMCSQMICLRKGIFMVVAMEKFIFVLQRVFSYWASACLIV